MSDDLLFSAFAESSENDKLYAAIVSAFPEMHNVSKDSTADAGSYSYRYVSLGSIMDAIRPPLAKAGLALLQAPATEMVGGGLRVSVTTRLLHESGQWIEASASVGVAANAPAQAIGSAITYARRYGLTALLGIASDDDDGAGAQASPPQELGPVMVPARGLKGALADDIGKALAAEWWSLHDPGKGPWPEHECDDMREAARTWAELTQTEQEVSA